MRGLSAALDGAAAVAAARPSGRELRHVVSADGTPVSYDEYGAGPALVLVHGAFSDHDSNWQLVRSRFAQRFRVRAIARRGRGATPASGGHALDDEAHDVAALLATLDEPAFVLGHSYGAQVALVAAALLPDRVRRLVLYEPPCPSLVDTALLAPLERLARAGAWDAFAAHFFGQVLRVPAAELAELRRSDAWPPIVADAPASLHDLRALARHELHPVRFRTLAVPTLLQIGSASPRTLYATDALLGALPDARVDELPEQAHEAMTTAPDLYAASVERFLLGD